LVAREETKQGCNVPCTGTKTKKKIRPGGMSEKEKKKKGRGSHRRIHRARAQGRKRTAYTPRIKGTKIKGRGEKTWDKGLQKRGKQMGGILGRKTEKRKGASEKPGLEENEHRKEVCGILKKEKNRDMNSQEGEKKNLEAHRFL